MLFPRFNRPPSLKLRRTSNSEQLPQNSRNNSRRYLEFGTKAILASSLTILFFASLIKIHPDNGNFRILRKQAKDQESLGRAISYLSVKDNTQAKEQLQNALVINPGNIHAAMVLSKLSAADKGAVFLEIEKIKMVLAVRDDYWAAWARLSYLYDEVGEFDLATDAKRKADSLAF